VVGDDERPPLRLAQVIEHDHRNFAEAQLPRGLKACVPGDNHAIRAHEDWICPAKFNDRGRDLRYLLLGVRAGIAGEGNQPLDGPALDLEIRLHFLMSGASAGVPSGLAKWARTAVRPCTADSPTMAQNFPRPGSKSIEAFKPCATSASI